MTSNVLPIDRTSLPVLKSYTDKVPSGGGGVGSWVLSGPGTTVWRVVTVEGWGQEGTPPGGVWGGNGPTVHIEKDHQSTLSSKGMSQDILWWFMVGLKSTSKWTFLHRSFPRGNPLPTFLLSFNLYTLATWGYPGRCSHT